MLRNPRLYKYVISTCCLSTLCQILFEKFYPQPAGPHRCSALNLTGHPVSQRPMSPRKVSCWVRPAQTCQCLLLPEVTAAQTHPLASEPSQHDVHPQDQEGLQGAAWTSMVAASSSKRELCFLTPMIATLGRRQKSNTATSCERTSVLHVREIS